MKGSYILVFSIEKDLKSVEIGSLGRKDVPAGKYVYVGSALGPGGIRSRLCRHIRRRKKVWWHIDYLTLREEFRLISAIVIPSNSKLECLISKKLAENGFKAPIHKFGSMDCDCFSHLFTINSFDKMISVLDSLGLGYLVVSAEELFDLCSE